TIQDRSFRRRHYGPPPELRPRHPLADAVRRSCGLRPCDRLNPAARSGATTHLLTHFDQAVLRPWDRALDQQQVLLGIYRVNGQPDLGHALAAEAAGHLDPLENP